MATTYTAAYALRIWMLQKGLNQADLGSLLGVTKAAVGQYLTGRRRPEWPQRLALQQVAEIDPTTWDSTAETVPEYLQEVRQRAKDAGLLPKEPPER